MLPTFLLTLMVILYCKGGVFTPNADPASIRSCNRNPRSSAKLTSGTPSCWVCTTLIPSKDLSGDIHCMQHAPSYDKRRAICNLYFLMSMRYITFFSSDIILLGYHVALCRMVSVGLILQANVAPCYMYQESPAYLHADDDTVDHASLFHRSVLIHARSIRATMYLRFSMWRMDPMCSLQTRKVTYCCNKKAKLKRRLLQLCSSA